MVDQKKKTAVENLKEENGVKNEFHNMVNEARDEVMNTIKGTGKANEALQQKRGDISVEVSGLDSRDKETLEKGGNISVTSYGITSEFGVYSGDSKIMNDYTYYQITLDNNDTSFNAKHVVSSVSYYEKNALLSKEDMKQVIKVGDYLNFCKSIAIDSLDKNQLIDHPFILKGNNIILTGNGTTLPIIPPKVERILRLGSNLPLNIGDGNKNLSGNFQTTFNNSEIVNYLNLWWKKENGVPLAKN